MKNTNIKKIAGLPRRYRIVPIMGALVVIVCAVVFGKEKNCLSMRHLLAWFAPLQLFPHKAASRNIPV